LFEQFQGKFSRINIYIVADSNNQYLFALYFYVDNKEVGWNSPSDSDGRIYATVRRWTTDLQDTPPTYDQAEHFLRFLDKYVSRAVGNHFFCNGVNQMGQKHSWIRLPHRTVPTQF
jgi:hypothetical protein